MLEKNRSELEKAGVLYWHNQGYKGKGVTIVVLDDGGHPTPDMDYVSLPLNDSRTDRSHATQVARVIHQIAPDANVVCLNYFSGHQSTTDWILANQDKVDLISCSFSSATAYNAAFQRLEKTGIPVICSSGNNSDDDMNYPARYPWTISVGAWEDYRDKLAGYSNGDPDLDCVGYTDIYVPTNNPSIPQMRFNGTSCAAPFVTAQLAILIGWRKERLLPRLTAEDARTFIHKNVRDVLNPGDDTMSGKGLFTLPNEFEGRPPHQFKDLESEWHKKVVDLGWELGLTSGTSPEKFEPSRPVTRVEALAFVLRAKGYNV